VITKEYKIEPELERCLSPLNDTEFNDLRNSIMDEYDVARPIVIWKGHDTIVDGHHRYKLCKELGVEPSFTDKEFDSIYHAIKYLRRNYGTGRSRTETQKAENEIQISLIDEKIAALERKQSGYKNRDAADLSLRGGQDRSTTGKTAQKIAEKAGVGKATVERVIKVHKEGIPELQTMMTEGVLSARAAEDFVKNVPKYKQAEIVEEGGAAAVNQEVARIRKEQEDAKRFDVFNAPVAQKTKEFSNTIDKIMDATGGACLLPNVRELICVDCNWGFDIYLPAPSDAKCPYCCGENIETRISSWNSREAILNV
jgi:ParB-like chromosome segregation protein Spo0J